MSATSIERFSRGIERCLCKAAIASNSEMEAIWLYAAENYRFLLEREKREKKNGTWERNVATMFGPYGK